MKEKKHALILKSSMAFLVVSQFANTLPLLDLSKPGVAHAAAFPDVDTSSWAYKSIAKVKALGLIVGDQTGRFNPDSPVSHQEAIVMALRFLGYEEAPDKAGSPPFAVEQWANNWAWLAIDKGLLVAGEDAGASGASWGTQAASREWITRLVIRAMGKQTDAAAMSKASVPFADAGSLSDWSVGFVNAALQLKVISGFPDQTFKPKELVTRAQLATILSNAEAIANQLPERVTKGQFVEMAGSTLTITDKSGKKSSLRCILIASYTTIKDLYPP